MWLTLLVGYVRELHRLRPVAPAWTESTEQGEDVRTTYHFSLPSSRYYYVTANSSSGYLGQSPSSIRPRITYYSVNSTHLLVDNGRIADLAYSESPLNYSLHVQGYLNSSFSFHLLELRSGNELELVVRRSDEGYTLTSTEVQDAVVLRVELHDELNGSTLLLVSQVISLVSANAFIRINTSLPVLTRSGQFMLEYEVQHLQNVSVTSLSLSAPGILQKLPLDEQLAVISLNQTGYQELVLGLVTSAGNFSQTLPVFYDVSPPELKASVIQEGGEHFLLLTVDESSDDNSFVDQILIEQQGVTTRPYVNQTLVMGDLQLEYREYGMVRKLVLKIPVRPVDLRVTATDLLGNDRTVTLTVHDITEVKRSTASESSIDMHILQILVIVSFYRRHRTKIGNTGI